MYPDVHVSEDFLKKIRKYLEVTLPEVPEEIEELGNELLKEINLDLACLSDLRKN